MFDFPHVLFGVIFVIFIFYARKSSKDPYGIFHLSLNKLTGEDESVAPKTEWLNQGYWKNTSIFPEACRGMYDHTGTIRLKTDDEYEALALKLVEVAQLEAGARILDVGHGTGESLVMFLTDISVPRPLNINGITSLAAHHQRSQDRITQIQSKDKEAAQVQVKLYHGDAICRLDNSIQHPLHPSNPSSRFDAIFALDCAYHFVTRVEFLAQAYNRLSPGGRVVLADMCFAQSAVASPKTVLLTWLMGIMPKANIVSPQDYVRSMEQIGYTDVVLEDITPHVFPGMVKFAASMGGGWWVYSKFLSWYTRTTHARFVVISGQRAE